MTRPVRLTATGGALPVYIEDVFSTYLYTGNSSTQTITNGINLAGKGGFVWIKSRSAASQDGRNQLFDTARGITYRLISDSTAAQTGPFDNSLVYNLSSTGFTVGNGAAVNYTGENFVSWTFRKQPKFFDVVTYTGSNSAKTVAHSLGSVPGCIIVKDTTAATNWYVYHRSTGNTGATSLNNTDAFGGGPGYWNNTDPTSTQFTVGTNLSVTGRTYVAYLFAHNAGGFGLTGTDNVISCGSYTGNGAAGGQLINLGYEAQWVMIKQTNASGGGWWMMDVMRGYTVNGDFGGDANLYANTSDPESNQVLGQPDAQGFRPIQDNVNQSGQTYIYIAIRRGPMKVPTSGTSVFSPIVSTASVGTDITTNFPVDMQFPIALATTYTLPNAVDRLRGVSSTTTASGFYLEQPTTNVEASGTVTRNWGNTGFQFPAYFSTLRTLFLNFRRAPSFFDEVCYTGTGTNGQTYSHNLGVAPELMIFKERAVNTQNWWVYVAALGADNSLILNSTGAVLAGNNLVNGTNPTASVFTTGPNTYNNQSAQTYVAYLFATCSGVSKVGSYTGTGTTKQVDCGFTGGARFVMIKRTDSTGGWYVWDSARGIVAGNDPYLLLNSTAAEVTNTDYVDTYSAGFEISSTAPAAINASGGTFIFLAIA